MLIKQTVHNTDIAPMARLPLDRSDSTDAADNADGSAVKSLRKALTVLNVVAGADRPLTVAGVAIKSGIARPTAYRFVQTLVAADYLVQDPLDGRLSVGFAVLPLASSLLDRNRLRIEALPHLHALAQQTGERANLGILFRRNPLVAYTPTTITSRAAFMKELADTRARGYAIDNAEHVSGSCCVATPIFNAGNQPIGAIGVSGRNLGSLLKHHDLVCQTAELVSHHLL
jgi:DNA-binding IclR family transcriptional regulator